EVRARHGPSRRPITRDMSENSFAINSIKHHTDEICIASANAYLSVKTSARSIITTKKRSAAFFRMLVSVARIPICSRGLVIREPIGIFHFGMSRGRGNREDGNSSEKGLFHFRTISQSNWSMRVEPGAGAFRMRTHHELNLRFGEPDFSCR